MPGRVTQSGPYGLWIPTESVTAASTDNTDIVIETWQLVRAGSAVGLVTVSRPALGVT